ncbi:MAG: GGDEF domain-containing protein [Nitrospirota bacterium]
MDQAINHTLIHDKKQVTSFQEKVYVLADEVLSILKELHHENKHQISSKLIAEKMIIKSTVKKILNDYTYGKIDRENMGEHAKAHIINILDKLSKIADSYKTERSGVLNNHNTIAEGTSDMFDSGINSVKNYISSISDRTDGLEDLLQKTMNYLSEIETQLLHDLSSAHGKYKEDRAFEKSISSNMIEMKQSFDASCDMDKIKSIVLSKIETINYHMEMKKKQDLLKLEATEKALKEMTRKMMEIKDEAEAMRKRSQEAEIESLCDSLTGLYNRKSYNKKIDETLADLARYDVPASMLVCDIDIFKKVNDNFGHHIGDLTLKKVAQIFKNKLRKNDFIARYGGEEFVCILPHTMLEEARKVAEEIRSFIDNTSFTFKGKEVPVTISIGVSSFKKGDNPLSVFERADVSLYMAKNSGRNLVKTELDVEKAGKSFSDILLESDCENN